MSDLASLEMRIHRSNDKIASLRGDVKSLKETVKKLELQLKDHMEAEDQRRIANYGLKK